MYKLYKVRPLWIEINSLCMKTCIDNYFKNIGFHKCPYNHALCIKQSKHGDVLFDSLYASDSIFTENKLSMVGKNQRKYRSWVWDDRIWSFIILSWHQVSQSGNGMSICQNKYAREILEKIKIHRKFEADMSKKRQSLRVDPTCFKSSVGNLHYLIATRPDILSSVRLIRRYMESNIQIHLQITKRILCYTREALCYGM